ncbi:similar to TPA: GTP binding protein [Plenodomus lingam JN3]|uniref:Similar to TPA: GTP binding protein n=1 Tax=Leptosphaeria maculans (strain JN3 / isolate v23.1.3 / race Av1-4-5-6-7-8) TaxID=985895 RepID=E5A8F1_LEPMJ|nr:similar to TPA: GTP binding protein [Plenodomus lingam JN3]CBX99896.1 similar to TPA: GTP binding protein [Plenodomus lingam JN3]
MQALSDAELTFYSELLEILVDKTPEPSHNAALRAALQKLEASIASGNLESAQNFLDLFATSVGKQKEWQAPYRETGILDFVLQQLSATEPQKSLSKQYLRVIGNSVADNDTNRELASCSTCAMTSVKLFNHHRYGVQSLTEPEPAKAAAAMLRLDATISRLLAAEQIPEAAVDYATDLVTWSTGNLTANQLKDDTSLEAFTSLLKVALTYNPDHYEEYAAILVHYLQDPDFQQKVASPKLLDDLVVLLLDFEARLTPEEIHAVFQELGITKDTDHTGTEDTKVILLAQLIGTISAVSSTDAFAQNFSIRTPVIERVEAQLRSPWDKAAPSTVCSCVILGNLGMSDEVCTDMVQIMELHIALIAILQYGETAKSALLYAAAGFMRHLTFPEANRVVLADAGLIQACCRMLTLDDPSVRGEAAAMLCKLVTNNFHNIEKVIYERAKVDSHAQSSQDSPQTTVLSHIVEQALTPSKPLPSTTMKNPMIELGRTIVAIVRYLGRPNAEKDVDSVRHEIFKISKIARPVARLVRQRFYADARSEGLLGLGLMAQLPEGASRVIEEFKDDEGLLNAIKDFANGKDGGIEQQGSTGGRDYQNAIVLLQALQNNVSTDMDATLKSQIVSLQEELGRLMV